MNVRKHFKSRRNHPLPRAPGEKSYNSKDASNRKPALAARGRSVDLTTQPVVSGSHAETVGKTSSKPQHCCVRAQI